MSRLPSLRSFLEMSANDRHYTIETRWRGIISEIEDIESGFIRPWNGETKGQILRSCRRRMKHLVAVATELSIDLQEAA